MFDIHQHTFDPVVMREPSKKNAFGVEPIAPREVSDVMENNELKKDRHTYIQREK